jgi:phage/plasmid primase-like uncharacterized protein
MSEPIASLHAAMAAAGLDYAGDFQTDGQLHRISAGGDKERNSWYVLHGDNGIVVGAFGCWKRQIKQNFCSRTRNEMSRDEWNRAATKWRETEAKRKAEEEKGFAEVRKRCETLFSFGPVCKEHEYLNKKKVRAYGNLRLSTFELTRNWIAIPLQDTTGTIHSAQFIADDGTKRFFYQGKVQGCYFKLAEVPSTPLVICEGYATGATIHEATGWSVCCAMNCGNLMAVCKSLRQQYPDRMIIVAADNDQYTDNNPGAAKALDASKAIAAHCIIPQFSDSDTSQPTDFNDMAILSGLPEVRRQLESAFPVRAVPIGDLTAPLRDDPAELLKTRYLSECGGMLIAGPTGMGKSSALMQMLALWSNAMDFFGITPTKALTAVLVQAENDDGDLAEMRDGVCAGLNFNERQRKNFFSRVLVRSSTGKTGKDFCDSELSPLLSLHRPNLLVIDPALSFLGGEANNQKDVGGFLRGMINPLLFQYRCAGIIVHHTNKPATGKEKPEWKNGEMAYLGSGSAEWANWARAVLSMQATGHHGIYKLHAAKRGARIGWRSVDEDSGDETVEYEKVIAHSKNKGEICWYLGDVPETVDDSTSPKAGRPSLIQRIATSNLYDFCAACIPEGESQMAMAIRMESYLAHKNTDASVSTCKRIIGELVSNSKIEKKNGLYFKGPNA